MVAVSDVDVPARPLEQLGPVIGADRLAKLVLAGRRAETLLARRTVWNVNSTAAGGGVAEMLQVLVAYAKGAGIDVRWAVIAGDPGFYAITKRLHNRLHGWPGDGGPLSDAEAKHYREVMNENEAALRERVRPGDVVLLHDPQTVGLASPLVAAGAHVIWRCHVGADAPNEWTDNAWAFLRPHLAGVDAVVVSRPRHLPPGTPPADGFVVPPSIDPFSAKNQDLGPDVVAAVLAHIGVVTGDRRAGRLAFRRADGSVGRVSRTARVVTSGPPPRIDEPMVVQVSRWDRLKDMTGVMRGFAGMAADAPGRLALVGPEVAGVTDDPEGADVLGDCTAIWEALPPSMQSKVMLVTLPMDDVEENAVMVNALQRHAAVVVQKSLAEGFGLTVAEAMWKERPVIGSAVGGITDQISPDSGVLLEDPTDLAGFGRALDRLLRDAAERRRLGAGAKRRVGERFLPDRHLMQYGDLFAHLLAGTTARRSAGRPAFGTW